MVLNLNWEDKKYSEHCKGIMIFECPFCITKVTLDRKLINL